MYVATECITEIIASGSVMETSQSLSQVTDMYCEYMPPLELVYSLNVISRY